MAAPFASTSWAESLGTRLQDSAAVRTESVDWIFGPIALVVDADAEHEVAATMLRVDLHEGSARGVTVAAPSDAARCPMRIGGSLARWKAVFDGSLSVVDAVLESKLRFHGDLPTLVRNRALFAAIAEAGGGVETTWQHEQEPAGSTAG